MGKGRLEAFSDGVLAIIITIMVLEMKVPHGAGWADIKPILPVFISYILSFVYIGIYWNNHHHVMHAVHKIDGKIMWANSHLLFWLSLMPFASGWMGENHFAPLPTALLGVILFMAGVAYYILAQCLVTVHGKGSLIDVALGNDIKGKISVIVYGIGIASCFFSPWIALTLYALVAIMWFIPDRRIETKIGDEDVR